MKKIFYLFIIFSSVLSAMQQVIRVSAESQITDPKLQNILSKLEIIDTSNNFVVGKLDYQNNINGRMSINESYEIKNQKLALAIRYGEFMQECINISPYKTNSSEVPLFGEDSLPLIAVRLIFYLNRAEEDIPVRCNFAVAFADRACRPYMGPIDKKLNLRNTFANDERILSKAIKRAALKRDVQAERYMPNEKAGNCLSYDQINTVDLYVKYAKKKYNYKSEYITYNVMQSLLVFFRFHHVVSANQHDDFMSYFFGDQ